MATWIQQAGETLQCVCNVKILGRKLQCRVAGRRESWGLRDITSGGNKAEEVVPAVFQETGNTTVMNLPAAWIPLVYIEGWQTAGQLDINRSISLLQLLSEQEWPQGTMINASVKCYTNQMVKMEEEGKVLSLSLFFSTRSKHRTAWTHTHTMILHICATLSVFIFNKHPTHSQVLHSSTAIIYNEGRPSKHKNSSIKAQLYKRKGFTT